MVNDIFSRLIVQEIISICRTNSSFHMKQGGRANRSYHAIYLKLEGETTYQANQRSYVNDIHHLIYLPKGCTYSLCVNAPGSAYLLEFDGEPLTDEICSIPLHDPSVFLHLCERMERLWLLKKPSYLPKTMTELYAFFTKLDEQVNYSYVPKEQYQMIVGAVRYLEEHYADQALSMEEVFKRTTVSEAYFRRIFKVIYHVSPVQYVRNVRVEKAKALLMTNDYSISDVAAMVGYASLFHFSKVFHAQTGITPREYRKRHSEQPVDS